MRHAVVGACTIGLVAAFALAAVSAAAAADTPAIRLNHDSQDQAVFEVTGLGEGDLSAFARLTAERRSAVFQVFVAGDLDDPPAIGGHLEVEGKRLRFTPRYPLEPDVKYRAVFDRGRLSGEKDSPDAPIARVLALDEPVARPSTVVEHIYPTSDHLPENQLKFYIHFSAPMSRGEAYRRVHLVDSRGHEVEAVFLELGEELWDGRGRRFTLYFDPGRVKRGLKPREELGPVLYEGRTYSLVVDEDWRDARRVPLAKGAAKRFSVGPPDDEPIDPARWKLEVPPPGGDDPLVVRFGEPLDAAQLERVVWVATASGRKLAGSIATADNETRWQFTPAEPWRPGRYRLVAETTLEDLAGNSIGRPFEVDQFGPVQKRVETKTVSIPFTLAGKDEG